jgi:hypothetical protein
MRESRDPLHFADRFLDAGTTAARPRKFTGERAGLFARGTLDDCLGRHFHERGCGARYKRSHDADLFSEAKTGRPDCLSTGLAERPASPCAALRNDRAWNSKRSADRTTLRSGESGRQERSAQTRGSNRAPSERRAPGSGLPPSARQHWRFHRHCCRLVPVPRSRFGWLPSPVG